MNHLDLSEIKSVIFDFDGLLVNSEEIICACWVKTCQHFDIDYPKDFFDDIVGVSKDMTYQSLCQYMDVVVEETDFFHQRALFIDEEVDKGNVKLLPGVEDFLKKLDRLGILMYIATSSSRFWPIRITERLNISQYFKAIYGYEDVEAVKPSPDLYLKVLHENHLDKKRTVIFEDSFSGTEAATRAEVPTVVVNPKPYIFSKEMNQVVLFQINSFTELETDHS